MAFTFSNFATAWTKYDAELWGESYPKMGQAISKLIKTALPLHNSEV